MKRGDVRWCQFWPPDKRRPVVILTRDSAIGYLSALTVAPITTTVRRMRSEVLLSEEDGMRMLCAVNADQITTMPKGRIGAVVTSLSASKLEELQQAIAFALGLDALAAR